MDEALPVDFRDIIQANLKLIKRLEEENKKLLYDIKAITISKR